MVTKELQVKRKPSCANDLVKYIKCHSCLSLGIITASIAEYGGNIMKKVRITQEQADAIERLKQSHRDEIKRFKKHPDHFVNWLLPIKNMHVDDIEKAYRDGYEIEIEYKQGEHVFHKSSEKIGVVYEDNGYLSVRFLDVKGTDMAFNPLNFRHATRQEIETEKTHIWWKKHDRNMWEIREGDILSYLGYPFVVDSFDSGVVHFKINEEFDRQYTEAECFNFVKGNFKLLCFVEDRKDI